MRIAADMDAVFILSGFGRLYRLPAKGKAAQFIQLKTRYGGCFQGERPTKKAKAENGLAQMAENGKYRCLFYCDTLEILQGKEEIRRGLPVDFFKIRRAVLAEGTDKISGQGVALIDISAYFTAPACFSRRRRFWFYLGMVIGISHRWVAV